jgi:hypothetical protein
MKRRHSIVIGLCIVLCIAAAADAQTSANRWTDRLIPLPKQIDITGQSQLKLDSLSLSVPNVPHRLYDTFLDLFSVAQNPLRPYQIRFRLTDDPSVPTTVKTSLNDLPNADQAYAIQPEFEGERFRGLLVAAQTPLGLYYGAQTLNQLVEQNDPVIIPHVTILDWPDLAERGQWGWAFDSELEWMSAHKLNILEMHSDLGFHSDGRPRADLDTEFLHRLNRLGIKRIPIIRHMEQMHRVGLFEYYPDLAAVPKPGTELPSDYHPPLCYSRPQVVTLLADWMRQLLSYSGIDEVHCWMSELDNRCYCDECQGQNPFVLEAQTICNAFRTLEPEFPEAHLRILLTQGSYHHNAAILDAVDPDARMTFYHGQLTYDSSRDPMIDSVLTAFATEGGWLGVYPQFTNSWRTVFPFSGPRFIRYRMQEFVGKGLDHVAGYATPRNDYYRLNIAAAAEYSWNSTGRSIHDFARVYGVHTGRKDPDGYADWVETIGPVQWSQAGSRIVEGLVFDAGGMVFIDGVIQQGDRVATLDTIPFGTGMLKEFENELDLENHIERAGRALSLARELDEPDLIQESLATVATLELFTSLRSVARITDNAPSPAARIRLTNTLNRIDSLANIVVKSVYRWGMHCYAPAREDLHSRFRDTVDFAAAAATHARRLAKEWSIEDPMTSYRPQPVLRWSDTDFDTLASIEVVGTITDLVKESGEYDVVVRFHGGAFGADIDGISLLKGSDPQTAVPVDQDFWSSRVNKYGRYVDYWLSLPDSALDGSEYFINIRITGPPLDADPERRTCNGSVWLRKSWRPAVRP